MIAARGLPVNVACRTLGVSSGGYYAWLVRAPAQRTLRHVWMTELIRQVHTDSRHSHGARRVHAELTLGRGVSIGRGQVELLMHRAGLQGLSGRKKWRRTGGMPTAVDLVDRRFSRPEPDRLWVTDIERHEALCNRAVVKGHRLGPVAAGS